jgi:hypothetical protein
VAISAALAIEILLGMRGQYIFNSLFVRIGINVILVALICGAVAYLSAKSYLFTGSLTLLIITVSFVYISIVSVIIGWLATYSANWGVTLNSLDLLLFSGLQAIASFQASFRSVPIGSEHRKARLASACVFAVFLILLLTILTVFDVFPVFFCERRRNNIYCSSNFLIRSSLIFFSQYTLFTAVLKNEIKCAVLVHSSFSFGRPRLFWSYVAGAI